MKRAITDLIYLMGLWFILRVSPNNAADLLEKWVFALRRDHIN